MRVKPLSDVTLQIVASHARLCPPSVVVVCDMESPC